MGEASEQAPAATDPTALRVARLSARRFRNLRDLELTPGLRFNVIHGDNGQGKSNLLEAVDYLGTLRSFRGAAPADMIAEGAEESDLEADVTGTRVPRRLRVRLKRKGAREVSLDGKRPRSRADYYHSVQMVMFHSGDMQLVAGGPDGRRAFLDRVLEQFDGTYATTLDAYQRALRSRNRLLRDERPERKAITAYDEILASAGAVLGVARARLVQEMAPLVVDAFASIGGGERTLHMTYEPRVEPTVEAILRALGDALTKDLARGFTADGPHADDLGFALSDSRARRFASQGQHRAIVLALKVAELHELERRMGRVPVLLLDDVSSELDRARNRALFALLARLGGQVFLTTTHPEFILLESDRRDYRVEGGVVTEAP